ncbi:MAG TPA: adenylate/guanylate cyclase domain-containing protein [Thermoleophilaceae bacterium]|nr:adenylate/guanylate cyclase domain-containing protein [Thermoleophilaceae bacterium]
MDSDAPAQTSPSDVDFFKAMEKHMARRFVWVMRHLPSEPRCRLCRAPYGGVGGRVMRRLGYAPSRKNPDLCNTCFEKAPLGGVEMEIGVLFADVRGFTSLAEDMEPSAVAELLNRFYESATRVLSRSAVIDKLVGDEVMAVYLPQFLSDALEADMLRDATDLLEAAGYGSGGEPWLPLGVGLDVGRAYVGNVGSGEVKDFTALGDVVNTAARLQSSAEAGQVVLSERLFARLPDTGRTARAASLALKGKREEEPVRVIDLARPLAHDRA